MQSKLIPLWGRGKKIKGYTVVDARDFDALNVHRWHRDSAGYVRRYVERDGRMAGIHMHRVVLGLAYGDPMQADHINRDRLDNRRVNLRAVTQAQNMQNRPSAMGSSSRFRGVYWEPSRGRWRAEVQQGGRSIYIGRFTSEVDAAEAVDAYRLQHMPFAEPDPALSGG